MARTAGSDGAKTAVAIRKSAIDQIAAKGFESVTLRGIAQRVGIQASSLYRYFPSKNDLLLTIVSEHMRDLFAQWEAARPASSNAAERLNAFVEFHVRYHSAKPKEVFIANMEMRSLAAEDRQKVVQMRKRYENILREILQDGVAQGRFSVPDTQVATFAILAMLTGLTGWYQEGGRLSREQLIDSYSQLVFSGVGARG